MTPRPFRVALAATVVVTAATVAAVAVRSASETLEADDLAPVLWLLTGLFALRVAGQVLVASQAPRWLPPMREWNLVPYRALLPAQLLILAVMAWIDVSFSTSSGAPVERSEPVGWALVGFSAVYAGSMGIRYAVRMRRRPDARWFGGTIPIVFHLVLATYLFGLGSFHAGL